MARYMNLFVGESTDNDSYTATADHLFSHADFLKNLARSLIHDEHQAEDLLQEAWLASIEKPPRKGIPLGAWLVGTTKNLARKTVRTESRRRRREAVAAVAEEVRSTEELVIRETARQRVVNAVLSLREPYRSAVLFRYYDDIPPRKIARKLGLSVGTVKTRLRRGLEQLRLKLDKDYNGNRKEWCMALVPVAGLKVISTAATSTKEKAKPPIR